MDASTGRWQRYWRWRDTAGDRDAHCADGGDIIGGGANTGESSTLMTAAAPVRVKTKLAECGDRGDNM